MSNTEIREAIQKSGMKQWEVAELIGIAETTFCRWMRRELPEDRKQEILRVIKEHEH